MSVFVVPFETIFAYEIPALSPAAACAPYPLANISSFVKALIEILFAAEI